MINDKTDKSELLEILLEENSILKAKLAREKQISSEVSNELLKVREQALNLSKLAEKRYQTEVDKLMIFKGRLERSFDKINNENSTQEQLNKISRLIALLNSIFDNTYTSNNFNLSDSKGVILNGYDKLKNSTTAQNEQIIIGEGEDSFNLNEVLCPDDNLDLADLCNQLGFMEED